MRLEKYLNSAYFCFRKALPEFYPFVSSDVKVYLTDFSNFRSVQVLDKAVKSQCEFMALFECTFVRKARRQMAVDA